MDQDITVRELQENTQINLLNLLAHFITRKKVKRNIETNMEH